MHVPARHCFQRRTKGIDLLEKVCDHINLVERDYFGLTYRDHEDVRVSVPCHLKRPQSNKYDLSVITELD